MATQKSGLVPVRIHGLSHDGRGVGRTPEGMALFLPHALPGQEVLASVTRRKKNMAEGEVARVLSPGPDERSHPCAHGLECGGCPWQTLAYPAQMRWKERQLHDALTRIGHIDIEGKILPLAAVSRGAGVSGPEYAEWGYRNKMEFSFGEEGGVPRLGLRRRHSRRVVEVRSCLLQTERTMRVLAFLRDWARESGLKARDGGERPGKPRETEGRLRFAVIREPQWRRDAAGSGGACLVEIITGPAKKESREAESLREMGQSLLGAGLGVSGFVHSLRAAPADVAYGEKTLQSLGETGLTEYLRLAPEGPPVPFLLGHDAFFQVNTPAAERLYQGAAALAGRAGKADLCWDLYCGVGGLTLALAPHFDRVVGLETMPGAVALARKNSAGRAGVEFVLADAARAAKTLAKTGRPALICADPPRGGLAPETVRLILDAAPARLVMVSCAPASMARDLALLQARYELVAVQGFDLFPQTPHVEGLALLALR